MSVILSVKRMDALAFKFDTGEGARPTVTVSLVVRGKPAAYALVWEWGRADVRPGPKTMLSTNPAGETMVMTRTAPHGFIRVNSAKYRLILRQEFAKIKWSRVALKRIPERVEEALRAAAKRIAELISDTAPVDTGDLRRAIRIMGGRGKNVATTMDSLAVRTRLNPYPKARVV